MFQYPRALRMAEDALRARRVLTPCGCVHGTQVRGREDIF